MHCVPWSEMRDWLFEEGGGQALPRLPTGGNSRWTRNTNLTRIAGHLKGLVPQYSGHSLETWVKDCLRRVSSTNMPGTVASAVPGSHSVSHITTIMIQLFSFQLMLTKEQCTIDYPYEPVWVLWFSAFAFAPTLHLIALVPRSGGSMSVFIWRLTM